MKKLGLNEALKLYSEGQRIVGNTGVEYWLEGDKPCSFRSDYSEVKAGMPNYSGIPYSVKDPREDKIKELQEECDRLKNLVSVVQREVASFGTKLWYESGKLK